MAEFSTLEYLTPLEVGILRQTANLGMISYDATPKCNVDDSSASESCSCSEDEQAAMFEDEEGVLEETGRIGNTDWCHADAARRCRQLTSASAAASTQPQPRGNPTA
ncbi:hypothetical protein ISCGN_031570 [Ixodes scapularis]